MEITDVIPDLAGIIEPIICLNKQIVNMRINSVKFSPSAKYVVCICGSFVIIYRTLSQKAFYCQRFQEIITQIYVSPCEKYCICASAFNIYYIDIETQLNQFYNGEIIPNSEFQLICSHYQPLELIGVKFLYKAEYITLIFTILLKNQIKLMEFEQFQFKNSQMIQIQYEHVKIINDIIITYLKSQIIILDRDLNIVGATESISQVDKIFFEQHFDQDNNEVLVDSIILVGFQQIQYFLVEYVSHPFIQSQSLNEYLVSTNNKTYQSGQQTVVLTPLLQCENNYGVIQHLYLSKDKQSAGICNQTQIINCVLFSDFAQYYSSQSVDAIFSGADIKNCLDSIYCLVYDNQKILIFFDELQQNFSHYQIGLKQLQNNQVYVEREDDFDKFPGFKNQRLVDTGKLNCQKIQGVDKQQECQPHKRSTRKHKL
ncbi:Conserved_hypothetical protein [Hexamita inflata]|uniref:Uncharacterized protein n=1 Tax=Hexamita inflata TaxID=28002 RepID=A0AA86PXC0_9EUKA|nr:Conserved hypothetical protein [Hexamita inflata]